MAKISKKQLGRRRRMALYIFILLIVGIVFLVNRCCAARKKPSAQQTNVQITMESTVASTAPLETQTISAGGEPADVTTALTLPEEPAELPTRATELPVSAVLQNPELPTGCEITSLTMALNYVGYSVDKVTMADQYLIRSNPYLTTFGEAFVGSPHDPTAWGCYAPVIVETAKKYIAAQGGSETVKNLTGCSLKTLLNEVANGTPVVTWASIGMTDAIEEVYYWTTADGRDAVFIKNEHCVLLTGYDLDANTVIVCDPMEGRTVYDLSVFEDRFQRLYQQAVVIAPADSSTDLDENVETEAAADE